MVGSGISVTAVAARFEVSRQSVHAWLKAYRSDGLAGLDVRSSRPASSPWQAEPVVEAPPGINPPPEICMAALHYRRDRQEAIRQHVGYERQPREFVFTTRFGTPVEPRNFFRAYMARIRAAGVRRITVHDARRTCASLLADLDVHPRVAIQILRHADFKVTMEIYTQVSSEQTRAALRRLGDSLQLEPASADNPPAK